MQKLPILIVLTALGLGFTPAHAGDAAAGKARAASCAACHGANGISNNDLWPNLAGQKEGYLKAQIIAFRDGVRQNAMMAPMVAGLSDEDAANIAAYYASLGN